VPRTKTQPVRLSGDLLDQLKAQAAKTGRSIPMEAEHRLRESLTGGAMEEVERQLAPWSRSVGLLVGLLANMHASYTPKELRAAELKEGLGVLLDRLGATAALNESDLEQAINFAEHLWLKLANAREQSFREGVADPLTPEQLALSDIKRELLPPDEQPRLSKQKRKE
jgi:hypothetical protein